MVSASRALDGVRRRAGREAADGTPATEVPGAMSTSDEPTRATTAMPAGMPIHSAEMALARRGLGRRPGVAGGVSVAVDGATASGGGARRRRSAPPRRRAWWPDPSCQHPPAVNTSLNGTGRARGAAQRKDHGCAPARASPVRARRSPGRLAGRAELRRRAAESSSTLVTSPFTTASMTSATSSEHVLQRRQEGGDLVVRDLCRGVQRASAPPGCMASTTAAGRPRDRSRTPPWRPRCSAGRARRHRLSTALRRPAASELREVPA